MFRSIIQKNLQCRILKESIQKRVREKKEKEHQKKEMKKAWKTKLFSPKNTEEDLPSLWFDPMRIKAMNKIYEKSRNTNRLTIPFDQKDLDEHAEFMMRQQFQDVF